jgi:hypothetical protein
MFQTVVERVVEPPERIQVIAGRVKPRPLRIENPMDVAPSGGETLNARSLSRVRPAGVDPQGNGLAANPASLTGV